MVWENTAASGDSAIETRTGFFGKVTSHGDFVARRWAPEFQQPWDDWLQAGLRHSKTALGTRWLETYLSSPIWRFALAPGVCGASARAGLLMPSVDRVGRHFPLTLARALDAGAPLLDCVTAHHEWYAHLESLALSSLEEGFSIERFDAALAGLAPPPLVARAGAGAVIGLAGIDPPAAVAPSDGAGLLAAIAGAALTGQCLWWTDGSPRVAPCMVVSRGLPAPGAFCAMLDGDWRGHGWPGA